MTTGVPGRTMHSAFGRILRNAGSIILGSAGGEVLTTYAIALCAVSMGPAGFGSYSEAQAFVEPFDAIATFGLMQVAVTVAAQRSGADGVLRGTLFGLRMFFSLVAVVCTLCFAWATGRTSLMPQLMVLCATSLLLPLQSASLLPFQFGQEMHRLVVFPFLASVVRLGTTYWAVHQLNVPLGYQLSAMVATCALVAMQTMASRRYYPERLRFDKALAKSLLMYAWPAAVEAFVVTVYARGNYFFLHDAAASVRGEFAAADRLVKPVLVVAAALFVSSLPTVATLASERNFALLRGLFLRTTARIVVMLAPIVAVAWYFTAVLLQRFAPEYAGAVWPFRILSVGAAFMFLNNLSTTYIIALGKFRALMLVAMLNLVVYLVLASQLIPAHGAVGAALSTTLMEGVNALMQIGIVLMLLREARREVGEALPRRPKAWPWAFVSALTQQGVVARLLRWGQHGADLSLDLRLVLFDVLATALEHVSAQLAALAAVAVVDGRDLLLLRCVEIELTRERRDESPIAPLDLLFGELLGLLVLRVGIHRAAARERAERKRGRQHTDHLGSKQTHHSTSTTPYEIVIASSTASRLRYAKKMLSMAVAAAAGSSQVECRSSSSSQAVRLPSCCIRASTRASKPRRGRTLTVSRRSLASCSSTSCCSFMTAAPFCGEAWHVPSATAARSPPLCSHRSLRSQGRSSLRVRSGRAQRAARQAKYPANRRAHAARRAPRAPPQSG